MRLLLDTHALIWHYENSDAISSLAKEAINASNNQVYVSAVSFWEIATKTSSGKLKLVDSIGRIMGVYQAAGANMLSISPDHALATEHLPWHHRDPFDRLLIAQTQYEDLTLVTMPRLW
jgi:PIN domain nuclease of toxin-antitoxin system